jgi:hypothetical protein
LDVPHVERIYDLPNWVYTFHKPVSLSVSYHSEQSYYLHRGTDEESGVVL